MSQKLSRTFSSWEEFEAELENNLKNSGIFVPGEFQLQIRQKVELEIFLPGSEEPVPAKGEVVGVFSGGVAVHLEAGEELIKNLLLEKEKLSRPERIEKEPGEEEEKEARELEKRLSLSGSDYSNLYQVVRSLSRAEKIHLAKRGSRRVLSVLIQQGDKQLFKFLIQNPHLSAVEVLQILKSPHLSIEIIQELARNPGWMQNEEIRYQMVIHPKTPLPTALNLLPGLNPRQLSQIAKSQHIRHQIKSNALKLVLKRQSKVF